MLRSTSLGAPLRLVARQLSTTALPSDTFTRSITGARIANAVKLMRALSPTDRYVVESMLRVDHSGEIAANTIYEAQADVFGFRGKRELKELILVRLC